MIEQEIAKSARLKAIAPQFVVPDVVGAAEYYRATLGFEITGYFGEPPVFAIVSRDGIEIHFGRTDEDSRQPNAGRRREGLDVYIWVDDVIALNHELHERGAVILEGPIGRSYGCTEVVVQDLFGFRLAFGQTSQSAA